MRPAALGLVLALLGTSVMPSPAESAGLEAARPLPPVAWSCPMHPEVVDDKAGACPICKMPLEAVRLELVWTCPEHKDEISAPAAGTCRICGRDLIRVTKSLRFVCPVHKDVSAIDPGRCERGEQACA